MHELKTNKFIRPLFVHSWLKKKSQSDSQFPIPNFKLKLKLELNLTQPS